MTEFSHAEIALNKLLFKLNLIPNNKEIPSGFAASQCSQIAFFARAGHYKEVVAISKIADSLGIQVFHPESKNKQELLDLLDTDPILRVSPQRWRDMEALPIEISDEICKVAMTNPLDHELITALGFELERKIEIFISSESNILEIINTKVNHGDTYNLESILQVSNADIKNIDDKTGLQEQNVSEDDPEAAPVVRLVNKIFHDAIRFEASDIHVTPEKNHVAVKARVDGIMRTLFKIPNELKNAVISRLKLLASMDIAEKRLPQDGRMRLKTEGSHKDIRLSTVPATYGENIVARILSPELNKVTFDALGIPATIRQRYEKTLMRSSKINLVTGPTGSGKTSTLYGSLLYLRDGKTNIITLEDPIEYRISGITQIQVHSKIGLSFSQGLRSILRQDPDIVLLGEIRDSETASIAMQVAQTGHLVLSTLHTNSAPAAITRLRDLSIPSHTIASSLGSVLAQRLVRRLCPACTVKADKEVVERAKELHISDADLRQATGCSKCGESGFKGRIGIYSLLQIDDSVCHKIRDGASEQEIVLEAKKNGFMSLAESGLELVKTGVTSLNEVERVLGLIEIPVNSSNHTQEEPDVSQTIPKRKILLVEDDINTRDILHAVLEREMFEVKTACDGVEALAKIYEDPPELVVSDMMMPNMNGSELLQKLKGDPRTSEIPVLMLTANSTAENELDLISRGANDFVCKATSPKILLARVHRLLK